MHRPAHERTMRIFARWRAWLLLAALAAVAALGFAACDDDDDGDGAATPPAVADVTAEGTRLAERFLAALASGNRDDVAAVLSPAFQIVRATGDRYDRDAYLANLPEIASFSVVEVQATRSGGTIVVSYILEVEETLEGVEQTTRAPRLSVFQWEGDDWLLTGHSNFGALR